MHLTNFFQYTKTRKQADNPPDGKQTEPPPPGHLQHITLVLLLMLYKLKEVFMDTRPYMNHNLVVVVSNSVSFLLVPIDTDVIIGKLCKSIHSNGKSLE